jgi:hypothetical protein
MDEATETIERREYERFSAHENAFVFLGGSSAMLGKIVNISTSGLFFHYSGSAEQTSDKSLLHILMIDGSFSSGWLPIRIIWDTEVPSKFSFDQASMRFSGVQFESLTDDQRAHLADFMRNYATVAAK